MSKVHVEKLFGEEQKRETSTNSSFLAALSSQAAPVDDTIPILPVPPSATDISKEKIGLFELSNNEGETTIDVVAVHGLQGDAYKTWEHENGSLWLRDFLPSDIPDARIMTFGYDSTVAFSRSVGKIEDTALDLLNHLSAKRTRLPPGTPSRPIVFICHSLGGYVVKKALVLAHDCSSSLDYTDISASTKAIAFLGVPHEGSDSARWADFATNLLKSSSIDASPNTAIVSDLEKSSKDLAIIAQEFVEKVPDMIIYTFYETDRVNGVLVVDKRSARTGLGNERIFPVDANHKAMCKIASSASHQYKTVGSWVAKLAQQVLTDAATRERLLAEVQTTSYYKVPDRRVRQFVGREDILQKIDRALSPGSGPRIAVLQGTGGQGKSQIALEYCHRKKTTLYPAIFWVDAKTEISTKRSFWAISEEMKKPAVILPEIKARVDFVLQTISSWSIRWLLVFDNYDNPDAFLNIADFIPQNDLGAILVTSSHTDSDALVLDRGCQVIKLQGMDHDDAILLLTQRGRKRDFESKDADEIVERLAYHPLAIMQAGAYIEKAGLQLSDFKKRYEKKRGEILKNTPPLSQYRKRLGDSEQETSLSLFTIWELFFQQLESQASEKGTEVKLLTLFAFLDNKDISEELFAEFKANKESHPKSAELLIWLNAFANGTTGEWDSDAFAEILVSLRDLSLLQGFFQEPNGYYHLSLYPLMKDWIRLRTSKLVGQENTYMAATLVRGMILSAWRNDHFQLALLSKKNILLHVVQLEEAFQEFFSPQTEMPANQDIFDEYLDSQFWFASLLKESGSYQLATIILERLVAHGKEYFGLEHPNTLRNMSCLASAYRNQGRFKELEELEVEITKTRKRVLGLGHVDTLRSTANLASTYLHQGRWKEAEELEMQVMQTRKRLLGLEHPETLTSMGNLASTYAHQGRWKEAEELEVQVLQIRKRVLGLEHPDTLTSVGNLASTYNQQGRLKEAEELGAQAMAIRKKVLGLEHVDTLTGIANLASIYMNQGRWKKAEELEVVVIQTRKRVLGLEHPDTLTSTANLATTYSHQGRWKEAEELELQVMQTRKRVLGIEHPNTLISMGNLASTYHHQGRLREAEELGLQVLQTTKTVLGPEHPHTLTSAANLASTYRDHGRWKEAEELEEVVIQTRKRLLGPEHPDTLTSTANLALTYNSQGRWKEAEGLELAVMQTRKRVLGLEHPNTLKSMANLTTTFWSQDKRNEAIQLMTEVVEINRKVFGPDHPDTIHSADLLQKWQNSMDVTI